MTPSELETLRRYVAGIGAGDLEAVFACLHPNVVLDEPAGLPYGGEHKGRDGFAELARVVYSHFSTELLDSRIDDAGEFGVARMTFRFTSNRTGSSAVLPLLELYWFEDGLIARGEIFYKDTKAVLDLLEPPG
jgi:ketosteroid isomerase-like protein